MIRGQRAFLRGVPAVVLDAADDQAVIETESGAVVLVHERELTPAEDVQSVRRREGRTANR